MPGDVAFDLVFNLPLDFEFHLALDLVFDLHSTCHLTYT